MRRGLTLAEVLLASGLAVLSIGLLLPLYRTVHQILWATQRTQMLQTESLGISQRLRHDYLSARPGSLVIQAGVISFLSYRENLSAWDERGLILWRKWVQYRHRQARLERREVPLSTPSSSPGNTPPNWPEEEAGSLVSRHLSRFEARSLGITLEVTFTTRQESQICPSQISVLPQLYGSDAF